MVKCKHCSKKEAFPIFCNACELKYCAGCIQMERHNCPKAEILKRTKFEEYANTMEKSKTINKKI